MTTKSTDKPITAVTKVVFEWSESNYIADGQEAPSLEMAQSMVMTASLCPSLAGGTYDKTSVRVEFDSGDAWTFRLDIVASPRGINGIADRIRNYTGVATGNHSPSWMTEDQVRTTRVMAEKNGAEYMNLQRRLWDWSEKNAQEK